MTSQATLPFTEPVRRPVARATDPPTSWLAAGSVKDLPEAQREIMEILQNHGPLTDEEIAEKHYDRCADQMHIACLSSSGGRSRRKELVDKGLIEDNGKRRLTQAGRWAVVWRAV